MRFQKLDLDALILASQKPTRYVGGEVNSRTRDPRDARLTWALCFPETYEIGMSNLGFRLLHFVLNEQPDICCERAFMPWPDMIERMRHHNVPLWSLESRAPISDFDVLGFSLQFEAGYTSVLEMLDLAGIPLLASDRTVDDPIVIGGGPCAYNPEPLAPFFDAFSIGEGEEQLVAIGRVIETWRAEVGPRQRRSEPLPNIDEHAIDAAVRGERPMRDPRRALLHERLAQVPGVYVPRFFQPRFAKGRDALDAMEALRPGYERVVRSVMPDLDAVPQPSRPIVPFMQTIHDRLPIEIQRGCVRGCRFCQAGMLTRPSRQRSPDKVLGFATEGLKATGYEEVGFLSLSAGDYGCINALLETFFDRFAPERVAISLPSLRTETMTEKLAEQIGRVRKSGFTIAPEAATDRLRRVINKGNSEENLLEAIESTFKSGWSLIKLYFMIGLPTETDEDVTAIASLAHKALRLSRAIRPGAQINVAVSTFIPKPFTPFQWDAMLSREETFRRHDVLRGRFPKRGGALLRYHEGQSSLIEGVLARGDRRVALAVFQAWREGQILDGWTEHFDFARWEQAGRSLEERYGLTLTSVACRERALDECLPWQRIDCGVSERFLIAERERASAGELTETCASGKCAGCGACDFDLLKNRLKADEAAREAWSGRTESEARSNRLERQDRPSDAEPIWVRVRYGKLGRAIAVSHLETINLFLRALRRAAWPVGFSQGFNPKPRVSFSPACPVGVESRAEVLDVRLSEARSVEELFAALAPELPENFPIFGVDRLGPKPKAPSEAIVALRFEASFPHHLDIDLRAAIEAFEASDASTIHRPRTRSRPERAIDLKAVVSSLTCIDDRRIAFTLSAGNKASAKPAEVIEAIFGQRAGTGEGVHLLKTEAIWEQPEAPRSDA
ncbi:MAG: TIGR03936 family radical SAM-associated protein [Myxococcales bacterium]|nr:TIGR03936 family radical SAM-associated protein [Myxococcales bacterium]